MAINPNKSRSGKIITGVLLTIISICLTILTVEVAVRFLPPPYDTAIGKPLQCDNSLGWSGQPNFQGLLENPDFQQNITLNSVGMHDTDHSPEKTPNSFRLLMLGDSFVQAIQVAENETSHQLLEDYLNNQEQNNGNFEVISGGVINWGTNQQLVYYREQGRQFKPDLVLLMFFIGNDFLDNLPGNLMTSQGFNCYAPYFSLCDGTLNPNTISFAPGISELQNNCSSRNRNIINGIGRLYQHSRLYQQIEPLIAINKPRQLFGEKYPSAFSALYLPETEPEMEQAWQITKAIISRLRQEVEADGSRFAVAMISPEIIIRLKLLSPSAREIFLRDNPKFADSQIDRPNQQLAEFMYRENIPFIDLAPPMVQHIKENNIPLYLLTDGHWTAEGNRVVAEILAQWLAENRFFISAN